jgi:hypothetical protein
MFRCLYALVILSLLCSIASAGRQNQEERIRLRRALNKLPKLLVTAPDITLWALCNFIADAQLNGKRPLWMFDKSLEKMGSSLF